MRLILASSSPRRRELLARLDLPFTVIPSDVEEGPPGTEENPCAYAMRLASEKARAVASLHPQDAILAADTVVALDGTFLGKPESENDAISMLMLLRGHTHIVATGVALFCPEMRRNGVAQARVRMRRYSIDEAQAYVATGEPMDKAGAYAVQGLGGSLVEQVIGCYPAVVGLPLCLSSELLRSCNFSPSEQGARCIHFP
jgi:septum formation protein